MGALWRLEPDAASSLIGRVAAIDVPVQPFTSALADLVTALSVSATVSAAAQTFGTRHRDVPARIAQRIEDVAAAADAVVVTIGTGDDLMAAEVRLADAAEAEQGASSLSALPGASH